jgi:hypothetical protein
MDKPESKVHRASLMDTVKAVSASFFGVRGSRNHERDMSTLNPIAVIGVGLALAAAFVAVLILVVRFAVTR